MTLKAAVLFKLTVSIEADRVASEPSCARLELCKQLCDLANPFFGILDYNMQRFYTDYTSWYDDDFYNFCNRRSRLLQLLILPELLGHCLSHTLRKPLVCR